MSKTSLDDAFLLTEGTFLGASGAPTGEKFRTWTTDITYTFLQAVPSYYHNPGSGHAAHELAAFSQMIATFAPVTPRREQPHMSSLMMYQE